MLKFICEEASKGSQKSVPLLQDDFLCQNFAVIVKENSEFTLFEKKVKLIRIVLILMGHLKRKNCSAGKLQMLGSMAKMLNETKEVIPFDLITNCLNVFDNMEIDSNHSSLALEVIIAI